MRLKVWFFSGVVFLSSASLWATYLVSRRAFLQDFNGGVHAYFAGRWGEAHTKLKEALARRPQNRQVQELLTKVFIEQSYSLYQRNDYDGALESLSRATQLQTGDPQSMSRIRSLERQLLNSGATRPRRLKDVLSSLYEKLPEQDRPASLDSIMQTWVQKSAQSQEVLLSRFAQNQERWLQRLEGERNSFRTLLYGGLMLFGTGGLVLVVLLFGLLHTYFGQRGILPRMLDQHYERISAVLPASSQILLGPPMNLLRAPESGKMDAIEAQVVSGHPSEESARQLESLLEEENPWIRARAAKILHRLNPVLALKELKRLVEDPVTDSQVSGMWALSELATPEALELLSTLVFSPVREIQQGVVRSLLVLQSKEGVNAETVHIVKRLLSDIRSRTGWIF